MSGLRKRRNDCDAEQGKFGKSGKELFERRSKLGTIPEWIPEMEDNPQLVIDMYKASVPG